MSRKRDIPPAIWCIGRNYPEHAAEMGVDVTERPTVFMKNPASVIGDGDTIIIPPACNEHGPQVDFEGELAVKLGQDLRDGSHEDAFEAISGYAPANDVTARWWQKQGSGGQWIRGKSFDTFCPLGHFVPADTVADPQSLHLVTRLNDKVMQETSTAAMIFEIVLLLAQLSQGTTLLAGTILLTGTPAGVGSRRTPPRWLQDGDVVEVEIEGVGLLRNPVKQGWI